MRDVTGIIKSTGTALEAQAYKVFGAAVENQVKGALGSIFGTNKGPKIQESDASASARNAQIGTMDLTKYAAAIAGGAGGYQPKNKFLFKVKFDVFPEVAAAIRMIDPNLAETVRDLTFVVKQIDLPSLQFDYQEVNMYNFRTKVLKSISYRDMDITFYDDVANNAINFSNVYLKILKPITRSIPDTGLNLSDFSMAFQQNFTSTDTSYRGVLPVQPSSTPIRGDILSKITIEQFYIEVNQTANSLPNAVKVNTFTLTNPRITTLDISELDYEQGGTPNTVSLTLNFDAINIEARGDGVSSKSPVLATGDILNGTEEIAPSIKRSPSQEGKSRNPFVDIIARQGQRAIQTGISNVLNKKLGGIAGGALSGAIGAISGGLGAAAGRTLASVASGIAQGIAIPSSPFIRKDSNTSAADAAQLASRQEPGGP